MNKETVKLIAGASIALGCLTYSTVQDHKQTKKNKIVRKEQEAKVKDILAKAEAYNLNLQATVRAFEILEAKVMNGEFVGGIEEMKSTIEAEKAFQRIAILLED